MNLKDLKIPAIHLAIIHFFGRFHVVAFTVVVLGGLSIITLTLSQVITSAADKNLAAPTSVEQGIPDFDDTTIDRIEKLNSSTGEIKTLDLPSNKRTNAFWE